MTDQSCDILPLETSLSSIVLLRTIFSDQIINVIQEKAAAFRPHKRMWVHRPVFNVTAPSAGQSECDTDGTFQTTTAEDFSIRRSFRVHLRKDTCVLLWYWLLCAFYLFS